MPALGRVPMLPKHSLVSRGARVFKPFPSGTRGVWCSWASQLPGCLFYSVRTVESRSRQPTSGEGCPSSRSEWKGRAMRVRAGLVRLQESWKRVSCIYVNQMSGGCMVCPLFKTILLKSSELLKSCYRCC